ncbi:hypothetical protein LRH25_32530, partial [Ideonella azotifigens]|uniref:hypothetical protein n=1 Tax=Ideonella azotifigens TaxID=513160 RepID=UPI001E38C86C
MVTFPEFNRSKSRASAVSAGSELELPNPNRLDGLEPLKRRPQGRTRHQQRSRSADAPLRVHAPVADAFAITERSAL